MLHRTSTAHVRTYLASIKWELFHQFADEFMGTKVEEVQADHNNLSIHNKHVKLTAKRIDPKPEGLPWDIELSLTFFRGQVPYDAWLGVQFAREICRSTGAMSYCDIPEEVGASDEDSLWKLCFYLAPNQELISDLVQLKEIEENVYVELSAQEIDLRNFELFHTRFPYR